MSKQVVLFVWIAIVGTIFVLLVRSAIGISKKALFTPSPTPTRVPTATPTPTAVPTSTPIPTNTPAPTATPTPTPTPTPWPATAYENYFDQYSKQYGVSMDELKKIADCETHINPASVSGDYAGMYQFTTDTWKATRAEMSADTNPDLRLNAEQAIMTAAYKIAHGGAGAWPNCR